MSTQLHAGGHWTVQVGRHHLDPAPSRWRTLDCAGPSSSSRPSSTLADTGLCWSVVIISTERYLAVCAPLIAYRIGRRRLRYAVVVIVAASIAFNAPRFFEFRPTAVPLAPPPPPPPGAERPPLAADGTATAPPVSAATQIVLGGTWLRYDELYMYAYNTALYCVVVELADQSCPWVGSTHGLGVEIFGQTSKYPWVDMGVGFGLALGLGIGLGLVLHMIDMI